MMSTQDVMHHMGWYNISKRTPVWVADILKKAATFKDATGLHTHKHTHTHTNTHTHTIKQTDKQTHTQTHAHARSRENVIWNLKIRTSDMADSCSKSCRSPVANILANARHLLWFCLLLHLQNYKASSWRTRRKYLMTRVKVTLPRLPSPVQIIENYIVCNSWGFPCFLTPSMSQEQETYVATRCH